METTTVFHVRRLEVADRYEDNNVGRWTCGHTMRSCEEYLKRRIVQLAVVDVSAVFRPGLRHLIAACVRSLQPLSSICASQPCFLLVNAFNTSNASIQTYNGTSSSKSLQLGVSQCSSSFLYIIGLPTDFSRFVIFSIILFVQQLIGCLWLLLVS